jgi:7-keto-8-aminopelargonate synthetase-like enzyme
VAYLNRVALDEKRREPRLDALASIFAEYDYQHYVVEYPCESRQMMYRQVEKMYAKLSAEQMERNRIACRKYRDKNLEKERARIRAWIHKHHTRHLARRRELYHASRCKPYHPTKSSMEPEIAFGVKKEAVQVSFD